MLTASLAVVAVDLSIGIRNTSYDRYLTHKNVPVLIIMFNYSINVQCLSISGTISFWLTLSFVSTEKVSSVEVPRSRFKVYFNLFSMNGLKFSDNWPTSVTTTTNTNVVTIIIICCCRTIRENPNLTSHLQPTSLFLHFRSFFRRSSKSKFDLQPSGPLMMHSTLDNESW